jgi:predicted nucleotidyltransferase
MLTQITQLAQTNQDIAILWLYGSQANQTHHAESDYDLGIAFFSFLKNPLETRLRPEMLALEWQQSLNVTENKLSIVDINQINIPLAYEIIQYNHLLLCRDVKRLLNEEKRIYSRMELDILYSMKKYA